MKVLTLVFAMGLVGCGADDQSQELMQNPAQYKNINSETLPDYQADRIELVPFCAQSCQVLLLKDGSRFFCYQRGGDWMPVVGTQTCELGK